MKTLFICIYLVIFSLPAFSQSENKLFDYCFTIADNRAEIYGLKNGSNQPIFITKGTNPSLSPDGIKLAYVSEYAAKSSPFVYIMDLVTNKKAKLNVEDKLLSNRTNLYPSWSPDGKYVAFNIYMNKMEQIAIIDSQNVHLRILFAGNYLSRPSWVGDNKICISDGNTISVIDLKGAILNTYPVKSIPVITENVVSFTLTSDNQYLIVDGGDKSEDGNTESVCVIIYNLKNKQVRKLNTADGIITADHFLTNENKILFTGIYIDETNGFTSVFETDLEGSRMEKIIDNAQQPTRRNYIK